MEQKGFEMTFKEDWRWKSQGGIFGKDSIGSWENFGWGSEKGFAMELCIPTQNPNQLKNFSTLLQTILYACNILLVG
jgi:hypothetical protein